MARILYPLRLAGARLRHRWGLAVLVGLGVAVGAGALAAVLGGSLVAQDRALGRDLGAPRPGAARPAASPGAVFRVRPRSAFATLDTVATRALGTLAHRPPFATAVFRESTIGGAITDLAAIEGLRTWVRLRSGRYPRACTASRCELIQVGGRGAVPSDPKLHLVVVGKGTLVSDLALGNDVGQKLNAAVEQAADYHAAKAVPILVANGVSSLAAASFTSDLYRAVQLDRPAPARRRARVERRELPVARDAGAVASSSRPPSSSGSKPRPTRSRRRATRARSQDVGCS